MKDEDDPFLAVMGFFEGTEGRWRRFGQKLDSFFEAAVSNTYMTAYLFGCVMFALLLASPVMLASGDQRLVNVGAFMHVSAGYLMICHQLPDRSFIIGGIPVPVCARDVGIYLGAAAGFATVFLSKRPKILSSIRLVVLATVPIALDGITQTILVMRESNNVLRLLTGLIFGFGLASFLANRLLLWRRPRFRQEVIGHGVVFVDLALALFLAGLLLTITGAVMGKDYMTRSRAVEFAIRDYGSRPYTEVRSYFISSFTPVTIQLDPYYENHRDLLMDDIRSAEWAKQRLQTLSSINEPDYVKDNLTPDEILTVSADKEHKFGIWAVAVLTEKPEKGNAAYIQSGHGTYYYYDPITEKQIMKTIH